MIGVGVERRILQVRVVVGIRRGREPELVRRETVKKHGDVRMRELPRAIAGRQQHSILALAPVVTAPSCSSSLEAGDRIVGNATLERGAEGCIVLRASKATLEPTSVPADLAVQGTPVTFVAWYARRGSTCQAGEVVARKHLIFL